MILHQDGLIKLDYDPASDILEVEWPEISKAPVAEITYSLQIFIDTLRHYDIKYLLIDASNNRTEVDNGAYKQMVLKLSQDLANTRLQKLARLESFNPLREEKVKTLSQEVDKKFTRRYAFQNFSDKNEALNWLKLK
ncbi:hypothetical protein [Adhaeribacter aquaticus]|uniref:hypothetical protein n=1 Tax=Adhaeribacter aquaticus TaxID=299567 RepID=UPI00041ED525|nr:hypothetical protein [Adhaeribacter aquaticus]